MLAETMVRSATLKPKNRELALLKESQFCHGGDMPRRLAARGHSLRAVRTGIEAAVLLAGWLLGGTVGVGTLVYGAGIGPLAHVFVPLFSRAGRPATNAEPRSACAASPPHLR